VPVRCTLWLKNRSLLASEHSFIIVSSRFTGAILPFVGHAVQLQFSFIELAATVPPRWLPTSLWRCGIKLHKALLIAVLAAFNLCRAQSGVLACRLRKSRTSSSQSWRRVVLTLSSRAKSLPWRHRRLQA